MNVTLRSGQHFSAHVSLTRIFALFHKCFLDSYEKETASLCHGTSSDSHELNEIGAVRVLIGRQ